MNKISILMYHQVGEFDEPTTHRATYCDVGRFRRQMAWLRFWHYNVISLDAALAGLQGRAPLPERSVVLTFDDGYRNFLDYAFPILQQYNFSSTVFLVSEYIDKEASWLLEDGHPAAPLLTRDEILMLRRQGVIFGAHTCSHQRLSTIERPRMVSEVQTSKEQLEALLGEEVPYFCYPYGDLDSEVVSAVRKAGFQAGLTCRRGDAVASDDPLLLPRKAISYGDTLPGFVWKLHRKKRKEVDAHACC